MGNISQSVMVCQELQAVLAVVSGIVADVKGGKDASTVVNDAIPGFVSALSGLGNLSTEVTAANSAAVDATVLLFLGNLKTSLFPGVV